jgi:hypothetical protein
MSVVWFRLMRAHQVSRLLLSQLTLCIASYRQEA